MSSGITIDVGSMAVVALDVSDDERKATCSEVPAGMEGRRDDELKDGECLTDAALVPLHGSTMMFGHAHRCPPWFSRQR